MTDGQKAGTDWLNRQGQTGTGYRSKPTIDARGWRKEPGRCNRDAVIAVLRDVRVCVPNYVKAQKKWGTVSDIYYMYYISLVSDIIGSPCQASDSRCDIVTIYGSTGND